MSVMIWKNTATLEGYDKGLHFTVDKANADVALLGGKPINVDEFPQLKGIFRAGISRDNIPVEEVEARGIIVRFPSSDTIDIIYNETADFTCGLIFRMNYSSVGSIDPWKKYNRTQFLKKVLLVIGIGNIGGLVAYKMKNFMRILQYDIRFNSENDLRDMVRNADFVTVHIPNTPENKDFFNRDKLSWMKNGAVLINTARGPIVNEQALYDEIKTNRLHAAFDVYWKEPYTGVLKQYHPERFYMTPHVASTCNGFLMGCRKDLDKLIQELADV